MTVLTVPLSPAALAWQHRARHLMDRIEERLGSLDRTQFSAREAELIALWNRLAEDISTQGLEL